MPIPYVELHCHSGFSFLDGASHPEELVLRAKELGYPALALTDHNGLYGSMEFARAARAAGLQPITGAEVTLRECFAGVDEPEAGHHVTLLAETPRGYANLSRLLTEAHMGSERGDTRLPLDSLLRRADGLILLTGCAKSPVAAALDSSVADAESLVARLLGAFGPGNLFVELQDNAVKGDRARNKGLARLAGRMGLGVVATGNVHYHRPERHRLQDVLVSIRNRSTLDGAHGARRANRLFHLPEPWEMNHRFESRPEALTNTLLIAERCAHFDLTEDLGYEFPDFEARSAAARSRTWRPCAWPGSASSTSRAAPKSTKPRSVCTPSSASSTCTGWPASSSSTRDIMGSRRGSRAGGPWRGPTGQLGPPGGTRARLVRLVDHLLPDRTLPHRSGQEQPLPRAASSTRRSRSVPGHRPGLPA